VCTSVLTAEEARALDARTIDTLPDSFALMVRAASVAADWLHGQQWRSAAVYVGTGNNGGDGWLIAGMLRDRGWTVRVHASGAPRTDDATRARSLAERDGAFAPPAGGESVIIDALLGTGARGAPTGAVAEALAMIRANAANSPDGDGAHVIVAIDISTGLDATTGEAHDALAVQHTLTFGGVKRGHLLRRDITGALHVLDIGLEATGAALPAMVAAGNVLSWLPSLPADAWKATRGRVAIVGGDTGMAGAAIIAARAAHASGAGMVRAHVSDTSALALQVAAPFATVRSWRGSTRSLADAAWPHAVVIGPGLDGTDATVREQVLAMLHECRCPVVLDAGALTAFTARDEPDAEDIEDASGAPLAHLESLRHALGGRAALLTPHLGEFRALAGNSRGPVRRFEDPQLLARALGAAVLLKGVPTIVAAPDGETLVSAAGNPVLAMGGTGDLLAGIAGTLLAQGLSALHAGAAAAWVHGTAADRAAVRHGSWRGVTMELLLHELAGVWPTLASNAREGQRVSRSVLLDLPAVFVL
jgi:ADP-dependent NAD(P)H-hydrate dehydratase / NAD(P)H-hydrate epimerase